MKNRKIPNAKYLVIGGNPFIANQAGLRVLGRADDTEEINDIVEKHYYECVGFMLILDWETGQKVDNLPLKHQFY